MKKLMLAAACAAGLFVVSGCCDSACEPVCDPCMAAPAVVVAAPAAAPAPQAVMVTK